jgi:hypothetical protein
MKQSPLEMVSDPEWREQKSEKAYRNAVGVAKRKNNEVAKRLPLFVDQIPKTTAEEVLETRRATRASVIERFAEIERAELAEAENYKAQVRAMVTADEFDTIEARLEGWSFAEKHYWYTEMYAIRKRREPLTPEAIYTLNFLKSWIGEPPTHHELLEAMQFVGSETFKTHQELLTVIHWLQERRYILVCQMRLCSVRQIPCATWRLGIEVTR